MKNVPRNIQLLAQKHAREAFPAAVHDAELHAALGDSTMFGAAVTLYAAVGDPSGEAGMSFYDCARHVMELGAEFKRAAYDIADERAAEAAAEAERQWVEKNEAERAAESDDEDAVADDDASDEEE